MKPCTRGISYSTATTVAGGVAPISDLLVEEGLFNRPDDRYAAVATSEILSLCFLASEVVYRETERQGCQQAAGGREGAERALKAGHVQAKTNFRFSRHTHTCIFQCFVSMCRTISFHLLLQIPYFGLLLR